MKITFLAITAIIAGLCLAHPRLEAKSTENPEGEKEQLAKAFVAHAERLAAAGE